MSTPLKKVLLILPLLLFGTPAIGQGTYYGFNASKNFSHFFGDYVVTAQDDIRVSLNSRLASRFSGGMFIRYHLTENYAIQTELRYTTHGARFTERAVIRNQDMRINGSLMMSYVEVPVLFRFGTWLPKPDPPRYHPPGYTYHGVAGISLGYNTFSRFSGDLSGDLFGVDFNESFSDRVRNEFNDTDVSLVIGVGFEYGRLAKFTFDIRYIVSLLDIGKDPKLSGDIRHGTISTSIGVLF